MEIGFIRDVGLSLQLGHTHVGGVCQQAGGGNLPAEIFHTALVFRVQLVEGDSAACPLRHCGDEAFCRCPAGTSAVEDGDLPHTVQGGLGDDGLSGAAGTHDGQLFAGKVCAQIPDGPHPADTVGIAADEPSVIVHDGVDGPCQPGLRGDFVQIGHDCHLVGHGEIGSPHIQRPQCGNCGLQPGLVHVKGQIDVVQPQGLKGGIVHEGGFGVVARVGKKGHKAGGGVDRGVHRRDSFR